MNTMTYYTYAKKPGDDGYIKNYDKDWTRVEDCAANRKNGMVTLVNHEKREFDYGKVSVKNTIVIPKKTFESDFVSHKAQDIIMEEKNPVRNEDVDSRDVRTWTDAEINDYMNSWTDAEINDYVKAHRKHSCHCNGGECKCHSSDEFDYKDFILFIENVLGERSLDTLYDWYMDERRKKRASRINQSNKVDTNHLVNLPLDSFFASLW